MAGSLVVVAVPDENDRVWKVSSEKVPHLTILYLGEDANAVENVDQIMLFVRHAADTMLRRFYLTVDRRGVLGEDQADVLFFKPNRHDSKAVRDFRNALLQDANVRKAYDAAPQFDGPWKPHLTLGYPETPANEDKDEMPFYEIGFNKIQVWTGDFEGPEFLLKDYWEDFDMGDIPMDVAMSEIEHFGVKGMRWGVRRRNSARAEEFVRVGDTKQDRKDARVDAKWLKADVRKKGMVPDKVTARIIADQKKAMKAEVKELNKKPEYSTREAKKELRRPGSALRQKYDKEQTELFVNSLTRVAEKHLDPARKDVVSPSGKWQKDLKVGSDGSWMVGIKQTSKVRHASDDDIFELVVRVRPIRDEDGYIIDYEFLEEDMAQTTELGAEFLEHYGVKGMRWGVRKDVHGRNRWDPEGHSLAEDVVKGLVIPIPGYGVPAQVRLARRFGRKVGPGLNRFGAELADSNWEQSTYSSAKHEAVHNTVAKDLDNHISKLQTSPKYAGKNLKADSALRKTYYEDVAKVTDSAYKRGVSAVYGTNYTGSKSAHYVNDVRGPRIEVRDKAGRPTSEAKLRSQLEITREREKRNEELRRTLGHADIPDAPDIIVPLFLDDNDQIIGVSFVLSEEEAAQESMAQTADLGAEFLIHYGVKGMRWGVRRNPARNLSGTRSEPAAVAPKAESKVPQGKYRKTQVKTEGGENHPASEDAIKVAEAQIKLRRSGTAALSNNELRQLQERLNLERNVTTLVRDTGRIGKGRKFVRDLTGVNRELNTTVDTAFQTARLARQARPRPA